ncbi:prepilin peptidase [Algisphaera agarilytica]|uniref:Leader peptidase (Prepilin peptidase)/N-methyltransferase n=1 Tax=Algisphaera agarilytica TaxID=1385975 RepID=A0A7X0H302_9BACT|nr:prepilin peptidase [Algisphaera agarilytica]MBB6428270.1 leader peptidase (prepilin peptidase)/N-methyltransferase [Algisphaera agarilytica]
MPIEVFALILLTIWGACVGSFLNVVIYRVPAGLSVISPPSRCPGCEKKLAIYDNVPVLGWLWLRGKCRYCKMKISIQYPLVEAVTGLLFFGLTYAYYFTDLREVFAVPGVVDTWPVLAVHLVLLSCMIAATMIDAKLYIIPLGITWLITGVAVGGLPIVVAAGWVPEDLLVVGDSYEMLIPVTDQVGLAIGGTVGLIVAIVLLRLKKLPLSFAEEIPLPESADPDDPNLILVHPHPRREIGKEMLFLIFPIVGAAIGFFVGEALAAAGRTAPPELIDESISPLWQVIGGVQLGYLAGGGIVWATRVLGTLGFGKEAMGLGDVHLMAAVGAVIGWRDTTLAFFIAPFFGIVAAVVMAGVAALVKGKVRVIPYGPYLCGATVVVMVWRTPILDAIFP